MKRIKAVEIIFSRFSFLFQIKFVHAYYSMIVTFLSACTIHRPILLAAKRKR